MRKQSLAKPRRGYLLQKNPLGFGHGEMKSMTANITSVKSPDQPRTKLSASPTGHTPR
jgi:hypothetical protein